MKDMDMIICYLPNMEVDVDQLSEILEEQDECFDPDILHTLLPSYNKKLLRFFNNLTGYNGDGSPVILTTDHIEDIDILAYRILKAAEAKLELVSSIEYSYIRGSINKDRVSEEIEKSFAEAFVTMDAPDVVDLLQVVLCVGTGEIDLKTGTLFYITSDNF